MDQFELTRGPFSENPYPIIARLREEAPLFWHERLRAYIVTRYEDVKTVIEDDVRFLASPGGQPMRPELALVDGQQHRRLRQLLTPAFSPRALSKSIEPLLAQIASELVDGFVARGEVDLVAEFADPMALTVVSRLLNVSGTDQPWLVKAAQEMLEFEADPSNAKLEARYRENVTRIEQFFAAVVERERRQPSGCLMSDMVAAEEKGDRLSNEELLALAEMLVLAGFETTKRLIANLIYVLLREPEYWCAVRDDTSRLKGAIEETLRLFPPNQVRMRYLANDEVMHGVTLKAGTKLYALQAGANRDPRVWNDPDCFNLTRFEDRAAPAHMAFGWGPHYCIGAYLAKLETTVAMRALLGRLSDVAIDPRQDVKFSGFRNRGPVALKVRFRPEPSAA